MRISVSYIFCFLARTKELVKLIRRSSTPFLITFVFSLCWCALCSFLNLSTRAFCSKPIITICCSVSFIKSCTCLTYRDKPKIAYFRVEICKNEKIGTYQSNIYFFHSKHQFLKEYVFVMINIVNNTELIKIPIKYKALTFKKTWQWLCL